MIPGGGTYRELVERWQSLQGARVRLQRVTCPSTDRTLLCAQIGDASRPRVAIAAGVHGDEPAGAWALLQLVERGELAPEFSYRIWPCTNPSGFRAQTRANADGIDVNRTFGGKGDSPESSAIIAANRGITFALSIDLHEDCDATGFYCYDYARGTLGASAVAAVEARRFPIDPLGCMTPNAVQEALALGGLSYSLALARKGVRALTFETPSASAWGTRIAMHATAVVSTLNALLEESAPARRK
jgi:predicted deacylase